MSLTDPLTHACRVNTFTVQTGVTGVIDDIASDDGTDFISDIENGDTLNFKVELPFNADTVYRWHSATRYRQAGTTHSRDKNYVLEAFDASSILLSSDYVGEARSLDTNWQDIDEGYPTAPGSTFVGWKRVTSNFNVGVIPASDFAGVEFQLNVEESGGMPDNETAEFDYFRIWIQFSKHWDASILSREGIDDARDPVDIADTLTTEITGVPDVTIIDRTFNESVNVAEADQQYRNRSRAQTDNFILGEVVDRELNLLRSLADNIDVFENINSSILSILGVSLIENIDVQDSVTREMVLGRIISDAFSTDEVFVQSKVVAKLLSENYQVTDSLIKSIASYRSLINNISIEDALDSRILVEIFTLLEDNVDFSDSLVRSSNFLRRLEAALSIEDTLVKSASVYSLLSENTAIAEVLTKEIDVFRNIVDTFSIVDVLNSVLVSEVVSILADGVDIEDSVVKNLAISTLLENSLGMSDVIAKQMFLDKLSTEEITISELIVISNLLGKVLADNITFDDVVLRAISQVYIATLSDSLSVQEILSKERRLSKLISNLVSLQDNFVTEYSLSKLLSESVGIDETLISQIAGVLNIFLTDNLGIQDQFNKENFYMRLRADVVDFSEDLKGYSIFYKHLGDATEIFENLTSEIVQILINERTLLESLGVFDSIDNDRELSIRLASAILLYSDLAIQVDTNRFLVALLQEYIDIDEELLTSELMYRMLSDVLGIDEIIVARIFGPLPSIINIIDKIVKMNIEVACAEGQEVFVKAQEGRVIDIEINMENS